MLRALLTGVLDPMLTLSGASGNGSIPARDIALRLLALPSTIEELTAQLQHFMDSPSNPHVMARVPFGFGVSAVLIRPTQRPK